MANSYVICGDDAFVQRLKQESVLKDMGLEVYRSGEQCRAQLGGFSAAAPLLLGPHIIDVAPINLVAALRKDEKQAGTAKARTIVLFESGSLSGSFVSRAHCAGADRVLSIDDLHQFALARGAVAGVSCEAAPQTQKTLNSGPVLMVTSGRGGVGKTTLSLLAALALARRGLRIALVDFDLQFGDLDYLLGLEQPHRLDELVGKANDVEALATQLPLLQTVIQDDVAFFACPSRPEQGDLVAPHVEALVDAFRFVYDITVVNTDTFWSDTKVRLARVCDMTFLICNQSLASIQACATALGVCGRLGIPLARTPCIINRFDPRKAISSTDAQFTLKGAQILTVAEGHREVEELVGIGCPEELFVLKNPCVLDVAQVFEDAAEVLGACPKAAQELKREKRREGHSLTSMFLRKTGVQ